jgi:hypothetical protein
MIKTRSILLYKHSIGQKYRYEPNIVFAILTPQQNILQNRKERTGRKKDPDELKTPPCESMHVLGLESSLSFSSPPL